LRSFIGMVNWVSNFIPYIHIEMGPFYNILS